ncbi:MAG TPA: ABC transporter ATP-binding protein [Thermomicrobiales bacterium]|nr:ABC transporter ATP-binding protein [Thermomicrobiales bacterium]
MARVRLIDVTKRFGGTVAVDDVTADIAEGEFVTLLGPSGCGKTTTLRMIAGLVDPTAGTILFDDQVMNDVPSHRRHIGLAFQSHALFPHLSVAKNIAFGLEVKGRPKAEIQNRVREMLALIELPGYGDRMPAQLSGGQQQRVALARMLATDPRVLLFDEPLSALDRNLRDTLKYSILDLQRRTKKTAIYVTHDQSEAFAISDRIFVMNQGHVEQSGSQLDIYLRPATEFVANFVGDNNAIRGTIKRIFDTPDGQRRALVATNHGFELSAFAPKEWQAGDQVLALVRPENIEVLHDAEGRDEPGVVEGTVEQIVFEGPNVLLTLETNGLELKLSVSGVERLTLLDSSHRTLRVRPREVSLVQAAPVPAA